MQEFKSLNGFSVKDAKAREDIENILNVQNELKSNLSNPNLLINSDFRNPINQRGNNTYNSNGENPLYTIDRWQIINGTITINEKSITVQANNNGVAIFRQLLENKPLDNCTFSVKTLDVIGQVWLDGDHTMPVLSNYVSTRERLISEGINAAMIYLEAGASVTLEWMKLEVGPINTPFIPRLYSEELALCKRFYQKSVDYEYFGNIMTMGSNTYRILSNYQDFRTAPTVKVESDTELLIYNRTDGVHLSENPIISEIIATAKGMLKITAPYTDGTVINPGIVGIIQISKPLEFDAEIY